MNTYFFSVSFSNQTINDKFQRTSLRQVQVPQWSLNRLGLRFVQHYNELKQCFGLHVSQRYLRNLTKLSARVTRPINHYLLSHLSIPNDFFHNIDCHRLALASFIPIQSRVISELFHYYGKVYSRQLCR